MLSKTVKYFKKFLIILLVFFAAGWIIITLHKYQSSQVQSTLAPLGNRLTLSTKILDSGAKILQSNAPLKNTNIYLVAFHPAKENYSMQMEAHHYCKQVNEDFAQCILFDGNTENANLVGIEYIVSKKLYDQLPETEKRYWHPHAYEILSGQLIAAGLPDFVEKILMRKKINTYGKTWHVWMTGSINMPEDKLPMGPAMLMWSFTQEGQVNPSLLKKRDEQMEISTEMKRKERGSLERYVKSP